MGMMELNWRPSDKTLRQFGLCCLVVLPAAGIVLWRRFGLPAGAAWGLAAAGIVLFGVGLVFPRGLRPFYVVLMAAGFPIGWVISHAVMFLFYFCILTPIGLVFRLFVRDVLHRKREREASSYWVECSRSVSVKRYFRQF